MRKKLLMLLMAAMLVTAAGCAKKDEGTGNIFGEPADGFAQLNGPKKGDTVAVMTTSMGVIKFQLFPEHAPKTVENFTTHAKNGYYDNMIFHRVIEDFMIQGGDPLGNGTGGESIWGKPFEDELTPQLHNIRGALSMANSGQDTNSSQFFIVQAPADVFPEGYYEPLREDKDVELEWFDGTKITVKDLWQEPFIQVYEKEGGAQSLDFVHTVFGQVYEGMDVVDAIIAVPKTLNDRGEEAIPIDPIYILSISIETY